VLLACVQFLHILRCVIWPLLLLASLLQGWPRARPRSHGILPAMVIDHRRRTGGVKLALNLAAAFDVWSSYLDRLLRKKTAQFSGQPICIVPVAGKVVMLGFLKIFGTVMNVQIPCETSERKI